MKIMRITLFAFSLAILSGCGGSSSSSSPVSGTSTGGGTTVQSNVYYKLKQGNTWTYASTYIYNPGTGSAITTTATVTNSVGATTNGITQVTSTSTPSAGSPTIWVYNMSLDASGNLLMSNTQIQNTLFVDGIVNNAQFLPASQAVNTTWNVVNMTYTVTSTAGSIVTSAGTFGNCLVVTASGTDGYNGATVNTTNYFSSTTGNLVYVTGTGVTSGGTPFSIKVDLTNYTLY